jgi:hypothetical protein
MNTDIEATMERLRKAEAERAFLLAQLEMWSLTKAQGIDIDTVRNFGFDSRLLDKRQKRDFHERMGDYIRTYKSGHKQILKYNCVWHIDGSQTKLDPMLKAVFREPND